MLGKKNEVVDFNFCFCYYYDCLFIRMGIFVIFLEFNYKIKNIISSIENRFLEMRGNLKIILELWKFMVR